MQIVSCWCYLGLPLCSITRGSSSQTVIENTESNLGLGPGPCS